MLNKNDSLSVAEILKLASGKNIEAIIEDRLDFLEQNKNENSNERPVPRTRGWAEDDFYIHKINELRKEAIELSGAEYAVTLAAIALGVGAGLRDDRGGAVKLRQVGDAIAHQPALGR